HSFPTRRSSDLEVKIATASVQSIMGLQLAPNGKIYVARSNGSNYLSVIDNPNTAGMGCDFINTAFTFTIYANLGLPNQWMYPYPEYIPETDTLFAEICPNQTTTLEPTISGQQFLWNTGEISSSVVAIETGNYWATQYPCS